MAMSNLKFEGPDDIGDLKKALRGGWHALLDETGGELELVHPYPFSVVPNGFYRRVFERINTSMGRETVTSIRDLQDMFPLPDDVGVEVSDYLTVQTSWPIGVEAVKALNSVGEFLEERWVGSLVDRIDDLAA
ncbi:MAG: hypothetical protein ACHQT9_02460 [Candidatus Saccharimonadales bacterium]